ncbi:MAG: hypothetical protein E6J34_03050 [Chloroflexi bacterium]|nr:MAG: hypothetical protein E6J34_03050 [Chloroflexota bacterium]
MNKRSTKNVSSHKDRPEKPFHLVMVNGSIVYQDYDWQKAMQLFQQEAAKEATLSITYRILKP